MKNLLIIIGLFLLVLGAAGFDKAVMANQTATVAPAGLTCYHIYLPVVISNGGSMAAPEGQELAPTLDCGPQLPDIVDFDGNGYADLAIAIPFKDRSGLVQDSGAVQILYGTANGLSAADNQFWSQTDIFGSPQAGDQFGFALAAGDFDGDGLTDLAVGVPGEDRDGTDVGQVDVIYGFPGTGLTDNGSQSFAQGLDGLSGASEDGDRFGEVLASGDFNGDGYDDLAVGTPDEDLESGGITHMGAVNIVYGSAAGLTPAGNLIFHPGLDTVTGDPTDDGRFGKYLAAGDFNDDGRDDLAVSIPGYDIAGEDNIGVVQTFLGSDSGLSLLDEALWRQGFNSVQGNPESGDGFGNSLAVGDFDGNDIDDLAIGAPGEDVAFGGGGDVLDAGAIHVLYGSAIANGLTASNDQLWYQGDGGVLGQPETLDRFGHSLMAGDFDGDGAGDLAVGVPNQDGTELNQGYVQVFYSNGSVLATAGQDLWTQGAVTGAPETDDFFGYTLTAGDYNGDGRDDLTVGVPYEDVLVDGVEEVDAGAVNVIYGTAGGLGANGNQIWYQEVDNIPGTSADNDRFGAALR